MALQPKYVKLFNIGKVLKLGQVESKLVPVLEVLEHGSVGASGG